MGQRIKLEDLEAYLWGSATLLRSNIDAGAYKQYIFPLLFFKRICDVYDEETVIAYKQYGNDIVEFKEDELHTFIIPKGYHWSDVRETPSDIGTAIITAFKKIEKANGNKLTGVFGDAAWTNKNRLPDSLLKELIEHFSSQTLSLENCPEDELGQGYEYLVKKFADDSGHTAQEFYTNRTVVHLMTEMLQPKSGESIYDPTCGSAGMLISSIAYLKAKGAEWRNVSIYGQEINSLTSSIGKMNLFLHGVKDFQIANADTLLFPAFLENGTIKQFDIVVANPPYSISKWNRTAFEGDKYGRNFLGTPPQGRADYAFIQHILKSMNEETGRCAILLPHGVLSRNEEKEIRTKLIELDLLECVVGIGKNLFYNSPMEACIMICRAKKSFDKVGRVLFIDAKNEITRKDGFSYLELGHIQKIVNAYRMFADEPGFAAVKTKKDLLESESTLSVQYYVNKVEDDENLISVEECCESWAKSSKRLDKLMKKLVSKVKGGPSNV